MPYLPNLLQQKTSEWQKNCSKIYQGPLQQTLNSHEVRRRCCWLYELCQIFSKKDKFLLKLCPMNPPLTTSVKSTSVHLLSTLCQFTFCALLNWQLNLPIEKKRAQSSVGLYKSGSCWFGKIAHNQEIAQICRMHSNVTIVYTSAWCVELCVLFRAVNMGTGRWPWIRKKRLKSRIYR